MLVAPSIVAGEDPEQLSSTIVEKSFNLSSSKATEHSSRNGLHFYASQANVVQRHRPALWRHYSRELIIDGEVSAQRHQRLWTYHLSAENFFFFEHKQSSLAMGPKWAFLSYFL